MNINRDAELVFGACSFNLKEFYVGEQDFNFTIMGADGRREYGENDYNFVYVKGTELEAVKNFLTTIRS